jgi:hypothetical protein
MDLSDLYMPLFDNDYNYIINYLYSNINQIIYNLNKSSYYSSKELHLNTFIVLSYLKTCTDTEKSDIWLIVIRNILLTIIKKYSVYSVSGEDEFKRSDSKTHKNHIYHTIIANTAEKMKLFILHLLYFNIDAKLAGKLYAGLDFEFNDKNIALCQILLYPNKKHKYIWIIDPMLLDVIQTKYMIEFLFTTDNIYKIVQGSDSLDIPYIFNELFQGNIDYIIQFVRRVIDTRFLCEFNKLTVPGADKKCSIYDAMSFFGTIDGDKYNKLALINKNMGPIQNINWNINRMTQSHVLYALYDVLFLKKYLMDIFERARSDTPKLYRSYYYIPLITRLMFLVKSKISTIEDDAKTEIDMVNNYIVKSNGDTITLITIYNKLIPDLELQNGLKVKYLLEINYFRKLLILLFKKMIYGYILENYQTFKTKTEIYTGKIDNTNFFEQLNKFGLRNLSNLFIDVINQTKFKIKSII